MWFVVFVMFMAGVAADTGVIAGIEDGSITDGAGVVDQIKKEESLYLNPED